ncbi:hypothetical protein IQ260_18780 [Leptolyngbya cf. ectocarpi LEGE 11479]|uniref:Uncharacterized protein n=1 Tax=Leptolyngbya cf. ectocarpi LEGE 11479 TaxID=1828722 RepID=A0A928ZWF0_LEPEC|nr:hypothetical protein [Leptolyngbya ectocarpi]MBE9068695.1 hypothetical protein [Leptolyngbya cf. ectocarpi LEGE 11479]
MSTKMLTQLVEAEDLLSAQEAALSKQLAEIQEQRQGLQTVIAMFDGSANTNGQVPKVSVPAVTQDDDEVETEPETVKDTVAAKLAKVTKKAKISDDEAETPKAPKTPKTPKTKKSGRSSAKPVKTDGRTAQWQRYVLDDHRQQRLQDVVANVLKAKSKASFKITDVMAAIFEDDMPKAQFLKARSRISNILSAGARDNDWYRGRGGTYSMSKKAVNTR